MRNTTLLYDRLVHYILDNQARFYRLAYSYTKNQEDALDTVQNAVCKALESYASIRDPDAIQAWFYRILVHECFQLLNKQKKARQLDQVLTAEDVYYEPAYEPQEDLMSRLEQLEEDVQLIVKLRYFEDMSLREIAQITGRNLNTVKSKLYRGLHQLKETMEEDII